MHAFLITSSMAAAIQFARESNWSVTGAAVGISDKYGPIKICMDPMDFEGIKRAVVHVGYFDRTPQSQALKRQLLNRAEARHFHLIEYETGGDRPPEPIRICLVCGHDRPCMSEGDLEPGDPGTPCTFDPTLAQLHHRLRVEERKNVELRRSLEIITEAVQGIAYHVKQTSERVGALETSKEGQASRYSRILRAVPRG